MTSDLGDFLRWKLRKDTNAAVLLILGAAHDLDANQLKEMEDFFRELRKLVDSKKD